jgi:hypothetical protein
LGQPNTARDQGEGGIEASVVVVLVNIQTPRVGLSWGHGHWRNPGRDDALRSTHGRTLQTYDVLMFGAFVRR